MSTAKRGCAASESEDDEDECESSDDDEDLQEDKAEVVTRSIILEAPV